MPLNTLRLNHQPSTHPNDRIVFIKPLPRPATNQESYDQADTFLRAIAAQCLPIMKNHYLSVTTLAEHEPNKDFIGRNFNNGEIIELVLRTRSGGWVPFNMVQMVMMHELAHNVHMNHGKGFWTERNKFSTEVRDLWAKGYTGEGLWGSGRMLDNLMAVAGLLNNTVPSAELADLPVCGGTFRSRARKRKRASGQENLTWKEKRDKRIEKKFGKNGQTLGEDAETRLMLEIESRGNVGGKPRVAQSKRGRELRAAAALARFGTNKAEVDHLKVEDDEGDESEDEYEDVDGEQEDAKDANGQRILDGSGNGVLRVCGAEDGTNIHFKREMEELAELDLMPYDRTNHRQSSNRGTAGTREKSLLDIPLDQESSIPPGSPRARPVAHKDKATGKGQKYLVEDAEASNSIPTPPSINDSPGAPANPPSNTAQAIPEIIECPICSMDNERLNATCAACAHVLDVRKDAHHWRCASDSCRGSEYVNAGDCGICGGCGTRKDA